MLQIGKRIPQSQRDVMLSVLTNKNLHDVADATELSYFTIRGLLYGSLIITDKNHTLIEDLIKKTNEKIEERVQDLKDAQLSIDILKNQYLQLHKTIKFKKDDKTNYSRKA